MNNFIVKLKATLADLISTMTNLISSANLLTKMVAAFLVLIIMPVATIGIISTNKASQDLMDQMKSISASTVQTLTASPLTKRKAIAASSLALPCWITAGLRMLRSYCPVPMRTHS